MGQRLSQEDGLSGLSSRDWARQWGLKTQQLRPDWGHSRETRTGPREERTPFCRSALGEVQKARTDTCLSGASPCPGMQHRAAPVWTWPLNPGGGNAPGWQDSERRQRAPQALVARDGLATWGHKGTDRPLPT